MRNRTYGGVRGRKVSLPCGKLTFLLLDYAFAYRSLSREYHSRYPLLSRIVHLAANIIRGILCFRC